VVQRIDRPVVCGSIDGKRCAILAPVGEGEACRVAHAGLGGHEATAFATSNEEAFDRDFRAVPSERPALPSEGTLHYSARAGPRPRRARGDDRRHGVAGPELFSAYMQKHLTSPGCLSISCRVHVCGAVEPGIAGSLAPGAGLSVRRETRESERV